jgi:hypothetical protein
VLCVCATVLAAPKRDTYSVVVLSDLDKTIEYKVMTSSDRLELRKILTRESRAFPRALIDTQKQWEDTPETGNKIFPRNAIARRKLTVVGTYMRLNDAEKKAYYLREREAQRRNKPKKKEHRVGHFNRHHNQHRDQGVSKEEKEKRRKAQEARAIAMFREHLSKVMSGLDEKKTIVSTVNPGPPRASSSRKKSGSSSGARSDPLDLDL